MERADRLCGGGGIFPRHLWPGAGRAGQDHPSAASAAVSVFLPVFGLLVKVWGIERKCHPEERSDEGSSHRSVAQQYRKCVDSSLSLRMTRKDGCPFAYVQTETSSDLVCKALQVLGSCTEYCTVFCISVCFVSLRRYT